MAQSVQLEIKRKQIVFFSKNDNSWFLRFFGLHNAFPVYTKCNVRVAWNWPYTRYDSNAHSCVVMPALVLLSTVPVYTCTTCMVFLFKWVCSSVAVVGIVNNFPFPRIQIIFVCDCCCSFCSYCTMNKYRNTFNYFLKLYPCMRSLTCLLMCPSSMMMTILNCIVDRMKSKSEIHWMPFALRSQIFSIYTRGASVAES